MKTSILPCVLFRAINSSREQPLAERVRQASTLWDRAVGLLGSRALPSGEGLWLTPCSSVHTFFMRYAIDVIFLDASSAVTYAKTLVPWRLSAWKPGALGVLELPAGTLARTGTRVGDQIDLRPR